MEFLLLLSSIAAGAFTVLGLRIHQRGFVKLFDAFTGAFLLTITCLHLLPELYGQPAAPPQTTRSLGPLILAGFFAQILLDSLSRGVEHGHIHSLPGRAPTGVMLGLCLHAFVEALALGDPTQHHDRTSRQMLLWSIVIHNYPVSIALFGMLLHSGMRRNRALAYLATFAAMAPLGLLLSAHSVLAAYSRHLTALAVGIFMHIATSILFESSDLHRFNRNKTVAILLGTGLGLLLVVFD
jgi:zinc transporter ZupT